MGDLQVLIHLQSGGAWGKKGSSWLARNGWGGSGGVSIDAFQTSPTSVFSLCEQRRIKEYRKPYPKYHYGHIEGVFPWVEG